MPEWDVKSLKEGAANNFADWYSTVHCFENDIFTVRTGASDNGLVFKGKEGIAGSTLFCLSPLGIDSDYLYYYLKYAETKKLYKGDRDLKSSFWEMEIPVPPIEEQKHISQSIQATYQDFETQNREAEKNLLDSFRKLVPIQSENLQKIESLEDFKKAILDLAVSGKLTEKWRNTKQIDLKWNRKQYDEIGVWVGGGTPSMSFKPYWLNGDISWITPKDVKSLYIQESEYRITELALNETSVKLIKAFSLLFVVRSGILKRILPIAINTKDATINQDIKALIPHNQVNIKFLLYCSLGLEADIRTSCFNNGITVESIDFELLKKYKIPYPSLEEQNQIVNLVETIFAEADKIQQDFDSQKKQQGDLLKSVINAFFQYSSFPIAQTDWDLDVQIKEAREKKEKEMTELKKKQKAFQNTLLNFGDMKKDDKDSIKKKIENTTKEQFASFEFLTEKEIDLLRDAVKGTSKNFSDDDFSTVFLEMTQELFEDEKQKEGRDKPFFESEIINGDTLAFKFQK